MVMKQFLHIKDKTGPSTFFVFLHEAKFGSRFSHVVRVVQTERLRLIKARPVTPKKKLTKKPAV